MEGILNLLRKLGYSENEIKTVLEKVPVEPEGIMGTNVATGIFSKAKKGEKKLAKDFLISDTIGNPFEVNYYKGRSRDDILRSAEAQLNMMDDELTQITDKILNKNLQLTEEQKINFAKNLETKRRFQKDFEAFKSRPEAEVLDITTKEKVGDVEALKEKAGLVAPPTTPIGKIDLMNKQMLQRVDELFPSEATLQKEEAARKALLERKYEGKGYAGGVFGPSGIYRSVARDFLLDQNAKGKIKLTPDTVKALEERSYISGGQSLMYPDPIRIMRFHYGDDIFDKIPLDELNKTMGARSDILGAMSKVEANPVKVEPPKTPGGYMTPGEMIANIEEYKNIEKMIRRRESRFADMTDEEILNELGHYGSQRTAYETALQFDHPEAYEQYIKSKPEKKAEGGAMGLDYLTGMEPPKGGYATGGRVNFQKGTVPKMLEHLINKLVEEKKFNRTLLEKSSPKAIQDLYIEKYGALPSAQEIKEIVNKQLQGKYSMETVNPKTGEVTTPKEPVTIAEKQTKEFTDDEMISYIKKYKEEGPTLEEFTAKVNKETGSSFTPEQLAHAYRVKVAYPHSTPIVDSKGKFIGGGLYNPPLDVSISDTETLTKSIMQTRKAKGLSVPKKYQEEVKAAEVVETPDTPPKAGEGRFTKQQVLEKILQSTIEANPTDEYVQKTFPNFIKEIREKPELANNENVWRTFTQDFPENKRLVVYGDDTVDFFTKGENLPEGMKQTEDLINTYGISMEEARRIKQMEPEDQVMEIKKLQVLKSRTQNANGGRIGYAEGSDGAPSITLDTHEKAPDNMDKYPIKAGNLELGIIGAMRSGKSTPDPYVKINTADRDLTVRGKYNVPNTGISLLGDIGDIRSKSRVNIDVPQYNYKETIKDVMKLNPYSVGIEYAPDQNRNINLRYDNQGNVTLRGEARFAKGGLGYLVGE